jgi:hypothetical protein
MPARSRSTSTFWPVRRRELPAAKARLAMVSFDFAARSSYLARRSALSSRKRALPPGGQSLRNAALDSARGEMRVEAVFAAIHAIEGHHPTSCHSDKLSEQNVRHSPVARRSNASLWQPFTVSIGGQQQVVMKWTPYSQNIRTCLPTGDYASYRRPHFGLSIAPLSPILIGNLNMKTAGEMPWTGNTCWGMSRGRSIRSCCCAMNIS